MNCFSSYVKEQRLKVEPVLLIRKTSSVVESIEKSTVYLVDIGQSSILWVRCRGA